MTGAVPAATGAVPAPVGQSKEVAAATPAAAAAASGGGSAAKPGGDEKLALENAWNLYLQVDTEISVVFASQGRAHVVFMLPRPQQGPPKAWCESALLRASSNPAEYGQKQ